MQKKLRFGLSILSGVLCAAACILAAAVLLRSLGPIVGKTGPLLGLDSHSISLAVPVLSQLSDAELALPWLLLAAGALSGLAFAALFLRRHHRPILGACLWILLFLMMTPAALWLTEVNGIRTGALLSELLPLLPALL